MLDNDEIVLEDAKEAAFALDKAYRRAIQEADLARMTALKPQVDNAYDRYSTARLNLLKQGILATDEDVAEMHRIRAEIDQAATTQALVSGAIKLALFLAKYA
ncbi:MAG: hypothetical protein HY695_13380 [Deltaproteobacteria bacterium]|nr:hypothetical protein [Deltaproteobacteria bacterium]